MGQAEVEQLTRREREVAALLAEGLSNKAIADRLVISVRTAEFHVEQVRSKLGLQSRAQVASRMASAAKESQPAAAQTLPSPLTSFIGREWEAATLLTLLERSRLATVTGPGGIGKTRLALEVARALQPQPPDGTWLVELARVMDPARVVDAISATLGLREDPIRPREETLLAALRQRKLLLLLDNCEHLVGRVATVARRILSGCPGVRVLATSRERLGVDGEAMLPLRGLGLASDTAGLTASAAVRLFLDRAQLVRPGFEPAHAELAEIAALCQTLEGMPLAIELAAARLSGLTPAEIRGRVERGQAVLATLNRAIPDRHRTLEAALEWSHSLLDDQERAAFRRLSVCAGFDLDAAEAVCVAPPLARERVAELLLSLVEKSLVSAHPSGAATGYRLLEPLRQYASRRLLEAEEEAGTRRRHADHFAALGERVVPDVVAVHRGNWVQSIERDLDNFRIALGWAAEHDTDLELRLITPLWRFWTVKNRLEESEAAINHAVSVAVKPSRARIHVLGAAAWIQWARGNYEAGRRLGMEALSIARQLGSKRDEVWAMYTVGAVAPSIEKAERMQGQAVSLAREVGDPWLVAVTLCGQGSDLINLGETRRASAIVDEALGLMRQLGDLWGTQNAVMNRGLLAFVEHDNNLATECWRECLRIGQELGDRYQLDGALDGLAQLAIKQGDMERGLRLAGAAAEIRTASGYLGPTDHPHLSEWLAHARKTLPSEAAGRAWAEGARMNDGEAIRYALGEP